MNKQATEWFIANIWTVDSFVQAVLLIASFFFAFLLKRVLKNRINDGINKLPINFKLSEILHNFARLTLPFFALIFVFISAKILGSVGVNPAFAMGIAKLLLAWMFIRFIVQLIENRAARNIIALSIWTIAALSIFGIMDQTTTTLDAIGFNLGEFRLSALSVIKGIFGIFILLYGALVLAKITDKRVSSIRSLNPSSRVLISKVSRVFLVVTAVLIGMTSAGIDLSLFAVFSGAIGLGIGFGLQKVISNLFSGMLLLMDQSIKPGDIIEMQGTFGWVNHLGARYTEIVTRDNKSYLVPNEEFITQQVINWSHGNTLVRIEVGFGVHYDSDPYEIRRLAIEAAKVPDRVVDSPSPVCHITEFGDSSINFVLRYWIKDAEKGIANTKGDVYLAIWDAFKENNINIPYPHREVFVHEPPKPAPKKTAKKPAEKKSA